MRKQRCILWITLAFIPIISVPGARAQQSQDCYVTVHTPIKATEEQGTHIIQDVTLGNSFHAYTLRYEAIEPPGEPNRILPKKWAPTIGYTPVGITAPSMACWYNQGFMLWTLDDVNLKDFRPTMQVVRAAGADVVVQYSWDTPKAVVTAAFAVAAQNDKLIMFGRIEPKTEIERVHLRLMAYPATFSKPWNRTATTALRTLDSGSADLDLQKEKWVLLEDVTDGRTGAGPAGLLLGDTDAFSKATVNGIGGYAEYVDLDLADGRTSFVLGFYEMPEQPDVESVRRDFRAGADVESDALAKIVDADLAEPLPAIPAGNPDRIRRILAERAAREEALLNRPAERWAPLDVPLSFDWLKQALGDPIRVALLCPRWAAFETMELARRLKMDVDHQYFDSSTDIANARAWPYARQTGVGTLGAGLATKHALEICSDASREVIVAAQLSARGIPERVLNAILRQVRENGKGLLLSGGSGVLEGWPDELTAQPDPAFTESVQAAFPNWETVPGLQPGERGRIGDSFPLAAYRYGRGRVLVWQANIGRYSALVPLSDRVEGLDGAVDRVCAVNAFALWSLVERSAVAPLSLTVSDTSGGVTPKLSGTAVGTELAERSAQIAVRIQDDLDRVVVERKLPSDRFFGAGIPLPVQPGGRSYFVDAVVFDSGGSVLGCGSTTFSVAASERIDSVALSPASPAHPAAVPAVALTDGGDLSCAAEVAGLQDGAYTLRWTISDALGRVLARAETPVGAPGAVQARVRMARPVTVSHRADVVLVRNGVAVLHRRQRFTIPVEYPTDDFTYLLWSYARGEPVTRRVQRLCYDLGADMMDLCHMRGYTDEGAAREYAVASRSGLRLLPYVTRIANAVGPDGVLKPGLFNRSWIDQQDASITICTRQAAPYRPPAYTLGDENYLARGGGEFGTGEDSMAAFRQWLLKKYGKIEALNAAWGTQHTDFGAIAAPTSAAEAAQTGNYVAWFDHRRFFDEAFAGLHEHFANVIREIDPGSRVGWDGFLGYNWQSGYNFYLLTRNLELNQTYTTHPLQGELLRGFAQPGSLRGEWGNAIADNEAGFRAISWVNLFRQHNSCWWWTSWGCDYIPFNPDTSVSAMGRWFFDEAAFLRGGVGRLLLHAQRDNSGVSVLYNQADLFAAHLGEDVCGKGTAFAPDSRWMANHRGVIRVLKELGVQFDYVAAEQIESDTNALDCRVLVLPLATCMSDAAAARIDAFVEAGGLVIADGRVGMLTQDGARREERALAGVLGIRAGVDSLAFDTPSGRAQFTIEGEELDVPILEPDLSLTPQARPAIAGTKTVFFRHDVGQGHALTMNTTFEYLGDLCLDDRAEPFLAILRTALAEVGVAPFAELAPVDTGPARRIEQVLFEDGTLTYLGLQQDIMWRADTKQHLRVKRPGPAFVYDPREGTLLSSERLDTWPVTLTRGRPALFSLMPYRVTGLDVQSQAASVRAGSELGFTVTIRTSAGEAGHHVVHVAVFAPGSQSEHRQYSTNVDCPGGSGSVGLPFALNDPAGRWRVRFRDAATGVETELPIEVVVP